MACIPKDIARLQVLNTGHTQNLALDPPIFE